MFAKSLLQNSVAVVTGGGTGIGYQIAKSFAIHGADVVITSRNQSNLDKSAKEIEKISGRRCVAIACDVRDWDNVQKMVETTIQTFGKIDILINNAAGNFPSPAEGISQRGFATVVNIDLMGTFHVTKAVIPHMLEAKKGCILSIVIPDPHRGFPYFSPAGAAKAGIVSLTSTWAVEWGPHGIRVNAIGPGPIPTEGVARNMLQYKGDDWERAFDPVAKHLPLRRVGKPEEIADAALFLCSPLASYITGVNLAVDGGMSLPPMPKL